MYNFSILFYSRVELYSTIMICVTLSLYCLSALCFGLECIFSGIEISLIVISGLHVGSITGTDNNYCPVHTCMCFGIISYF